MKEKVLFVDTAHPLLHDSLENLGFQCDYFPQFGYDAYLKIIANYSGIIVRSKIPIDRTLLTAAKQLRFIGRVGAGLENIDVDFASKLGIHCLNAPEGNRDAVAEHAIGMLLSLLNKLMKADNEVRQGIWRRDENRGVEIKGKTIGIIGFGNTGAAFAKKLSGFDARIIAYDKYKSGFSTEYVQQVSMQEMFQQTDVLSLHIPLSAETHYLVNADFIQQFNKPIYIINTSRGNCLKTIDLISALENGKVKGACLDVLEYEKFSFEDIQKHNLPETFIKLTQLENVVLSPHIAGWTHESHIGLSLVLAEKIKNSL